MLVSIIEVKILFLKDFLRYELNSNPSSFDKEPNDTTLIYANFRTDRNMTNLHNI